MPDSRELKFRLIKDSKIVGYEVAFLTLDQPNGLLEWLYSENESCKQLRTILIPHDTKDQFTGLLDRNEKPIFESDIFKMPRGNIVVVQWESEQSPGFSGIPVNPNDDGPYAIGFTSHGKLGEVIGNTHQNPELLEPNATE